MIQRVQTLYILLGTLLVTLTLFFVPQIGVNHEDPTEAVKLLYFFSTSMGPVKIMSIIVFTLCIITTLVAILSFKKYKLQSRIVLFLFMILGVMVGMSVGKVTNPLLKGCFPAELVEDGFVSFNYTYFFIFLFLLLLGAVFYLLAGRAIKKDRDLINSINRLR